MLPLLLFRLLQGLWQLFRRLTVVFHRRPGAGELGAEFLYAAFLFVNHAAQLGDSRRRGVASRGYAAQIILKRRNFGFKF